MAELVIIAMGKIIAVAMALVFFLCAINSEDEIDREICAVLFLSEVLVAVSLFIK